MKIQTKLQENCSIIKQNLKEQTGWNRKVYQHGIHSKYQDKIKRVGIIYPRFPHHKKDINHVGK